MNFDFFFYLLYFSTRPECSVCFRCGKGWVETPPKKNMMSQALWVDLCLYFDNRWRKRWGECWKLWCQHWSNFVFWNPFNLIVQLVWPPTVYCVLFWFVGVSFQPLNCWFLFWTIILFVFDTHWKIASPTLAQTSYLKTYRPKPRIISTQDSNFFSKHSNTIPAFRRLATSAFRRG